MDDATHHNRIIDVLEVYLLTQDLVLTCAYNVAPRLVDAALAHKGVAHFLFHPAHIRKPGIAQAITDIVTYGREHGLEWWTCAQINDWERARRKVRIVPVEQPGERGGGTGEDRRAQGRLGMAANATVGSACGASYDVIGTDEPLDVTLSFALPDGVAAAQAWVAPLSEGGRGDSGAQPAELHPLRYAGCDLVAVDVTLAPGVRVTLRW